MNLNETASTFRERAGVFAALFLVVCFGLSGIALALILFWSGTRIDFDATWMSSMVVLVGTAAGFLFGKQTSNPPAPAVSRAPEAG